MTVKLSDFGLSGFQTMQNNYFCGTFDYLSPEMLENQSVSKRLDIWSLGILLYELLVGDVPYKAKSEQQLLNQIKRLRVTFPGHITKPAQNLIKKMLRYNPYERISLDDILAHPWITGILM